MWNTQIMGVNKSQLCSSGSYHLFKCYLGVRLLSSLVPEWKFYFLVHSLLIDSLLRNSPLKLKNTV